ncbi:hypothetical protein MBLNU230_g3279t1 [Neophaeotheca triangularis]
MNSRAGGPHPNQRANYGMPHQNNPNTTATAAATGNVNFANPSRQQPLGSTGAAGRLQQQQQQQQQQGNTAPNQKNAASAGLSNGWNAGFGSGAGGFGAGGGGGPGAFGGLAGGAPGLGSAQQAQGQAQGQGQAQAQGRTGQLSGFAQVMGGGGGGGQGLDMSDFPSLSGGPQPTSSAASAWNSNNIRQQRPPQTQQPQQPQQPPPQQRASSVAPSQHSLDNSESIRSQQPSGNDWPASSVQSNGDNYRHGAGITFQQNQQAPIGQGQQPNPQVHQNGFGAAPMTESPISASNPPQQKPSQGVPNGQQQSRDKPIKRYADMDEEEKYGLAGLTAAFEARKQAESGGQVDETLPATMRSALFMGQDLQSLGMDLDSAEPMHTTFTPFPSAASGASAYDFHDRHMIPDFTLPAAYTVTNVPPIQQRIGVFSDETLFSIFYQNPRSMLQEIAAVELTVRDWRYHTILRQWLQKDSRENNATASALSIVDLTNGSPINQDPVRMSQHTEKGVYIFFDAMNWRRERREFVLDWEQLDDRGVGGGSGSGSGSAAGSVSMLGRGAPGLEQRVLSAGSAAGAAGAGSAGLAPSGMGSSGIVANNA